MGLIQRGRDLERFFKSSSFILDSQQIRTQKQPDGRIQLHARPVRPVTLVTPPPSGAPLSHIWIGNDLSFQAQSSINDPGVYQVFPADVIPADGGTFLYVPDGGGTLYAPDFVNHANTAADNTFPNTPWTTFTGVTDLADPPHTVTTSVGGIVQTDTWIPGTDYWTTEITSPGGILFRAFDAFLFGDDTSYGFVEAGDFGSAIGASENANNSPPGKIAQLIPLTAGSSYYEDQFDLVWAAIHTGAAFPNTCAATTLLDSGLGLAWASGTSFSMKTRISAPA
jgi:hypothetical protein